MEDWAETLLAANVIRNLGTGKVNHELTSKILETCPNIYIAIMHAINNSNHKQVEVVYCDPIFNKRILNPEISYEDVLYYRLQERLKRVRITILNQGLIGNELRLLVKRN